MLTTVKGTFKKGKVELTETPSGIAEETEVLVTFLPTETSAVSPQPQALYGAWRGKFPQDFDLDAALREIRNESQKKWEEDGANA